MAVAYPNVPGVVFKDIEGYPGYCVGDNSWIFSCRKAGRARNRLGSPWHRIKTHALRGRYEQVCLRAAHGGKLRSLYVHHVVLDAFVGTRPPGTEACHGPGGSLDNRLSNLRWDTPEANNQDKYLHGTIPLGESHHATSLTNDDVIEMRWLKFACPSLHFKSIAWLYGVQSAVASRAIRGKRWGHIEGAVNFQYDVLTRRDLQVGLKHDYPAKRG